MTLKDHEGCTPLHLACGSSLDSAMEMQTTIVVDTLTSHGAGVNAKVQIKSNHDSWSPYPVIFIF